MESSTPPPAPLLDRLAELLESYESLPAFTLLSFLGGLAPLRVEADRTGALPGRVDAALENLTKTWREASRGNRGTFSFDSERQLLEALDRLRAEVRAARGKAPLR